MRAPPALVVAVLLFAGCLGQATHEGAVPFGFSGKFMPTVGAAQILELGDRVRAEGGELSVVDKLPPLFTAWGLTPRGCDVVREYAATLLFIDVMGGCEPASITTAEPVLAPADRSNSGTLSEEA